jgi:hypothetical protein
VTALGPTPTPLDRRVRDMLPAEPPGVRARTLALRLNRYVYGTPEQRARKRAEQIAELRGILRGFEHLGQATGRGGWWRRIDPKENP